MITMKNPTLLSAILFLSLVVRKAATTGAREPYCGPIPASDKDRVHFAMNLEYLEAEYFLHGAFGHGLDYFAPNLTKGGPPPIGGQKANLEPEVARPIIEQFAYQEIGHLSAIYRRFGGIRRPLLDISRETFAQIFSEAFSEKLHPPFDPYANTINYMLSCYLLPYVGLNGYTGTIPHLANYTSKELVSGLLGTESGQDAVLRTYLFERRFEKVFPYDITVWEVTDKLSDLRNRLGMCGIKDEGLIVPPYLGAQGKLKDNVLSEDEESLSYRRTPQEILRIVYNSGNEHVPGGFYPHGANGRIARRFLEEKP